MSVNSKQSCALFIQRLKDKVNALVKVHKRQIHTHLLQLQNA